MGFVKIGEGTIVGVVNSSEVIDELATEQLKVAKENSKKPEVTANKTESNSNDQNFTEKS